MKGQKLLDIFIYKVEQDKEKYLKEAGDILTNCDLEWNDNYESLYGYTPPFDESQIEELIDFKIAISAFNAVCDILDFIKTHDTTKEKDL